MADETRARRGRPAAASSEETFDRIIDAARALFARRGYAGTQNRDVAEAAGVTASALYHYFGSKLDMYASVFRETESRLADRLESRISASDSTRERLAGFVRAARGLHEDDPAALVFLAGVPIEIRNDRDVARRIAECPIRCDGIIRQILVDGRERGEVREDSDVDGAAALVIAMAQGIALYATFEGVDAYEGLSRALERWMLDDLLVDGR